MAQGSQVRRRSGRLRVKSLLDRGFVYVQLKDQGPDYLRERMKMYREREEKRAKEKAEKVSEIKPRIRSKS